MPAYSWQALDKQGKTQKGTSEADSPQLLRQSLRSDGLNPLSISEIAKVAKQSTGQIAFSSYVRKLSTGELSVLTRQIATLLKSGLPIDSALATMVLQAEKSKSKNLLVAVRAKITEGYTFAQALSGFEHVFPDYYIATVAAGEKAGKVGMVLDRLSGYLQTANATRNKITLALIYPAFVVIVGIAVVISLLAFVVPDIVKVFDNMDQELPMMTQILIAISGFLRHWGGELLVALLSVFVIFRILLRNQAFKMAWHHFLLKIPLYGRLLRERSIARFIRTLSILLESRVDITDSMRIASDVIAILPIKQALKKASQKVQDGTSVGVALAEMNYLSPILLSLISSGERSGALAEMLLQGAENQEEDTLITISILVGVFEPVMILLMGMVVLFIVVAILVPIFDMNTLIK